MNFSSLPVTIRTIRHLRLSQVLARLARYGRKRSKLDPGVPHPLLVQACESVPAIPEFDHRCARGTALVESLKSGRLPLLNQSHHLGREDCDWRLGAVVSDRLTAITLHYHQWLYELAKLAGGHDESAMQARRLFERYLADWLEHCDLEQPGADALVWNSYAIATRLGWSVRAYRKLVQVDARLPSPLMDRWLKSLWCQASFLQANLEWDLRANHLLRDAVGLAWAGRFFHGEEARRWLETAAQIAESQVDEQMLDDGGHFERSPFYHLEVMDDWRTLSLLLPDRQTSDKLRATWQRAAEYARWLCHPDGRVAQFNDGAAAVAAPYLAPDAACPHDIASPRGGRWFKDSGVIAWHGDPWTLFWDVGEVGPDYQPGHAHADTLTIEASYRGRRLFVDPGCHSYDHDARRKYDRSTIAHNTVCIDQQDSSEMWHIFRVGRRARPLATETSMSTNRLWARASHTGYDHLAGSPKHTRTVMVEDRGHLQIVDDVKGRGNHDIRGGFLLSPEWQGSAVPGGWELTDRDATLRIDLASNRELTTSVERHPIHADYGLEQETQRLCWSYQGELPLQVTLHIEPTSPTCS